MKSERLNLSDFKLKKNDAKENEDVSKLMGTVLGVCHDASVGTEKTSVGDVGTKPDVYIDNQSIA
jgi:hypothetical protein